MKSLKSISPNQVCLQHLIQLPQEKVPKSIPLKLMLSTPPLPTHQIPQHLILLLIKLDHCPSECISVFQDKKFNGV